MRGQMIFTNGRLTFPESVADGLALRVAEGRIAEIAERIAPERGEEVIDLAGHFLAPGFIDLHVHGAVGRDTMEGTAEAFRAICAHHLAGGTTSLCLTTVTAPLEEIARVVEAIGAAMATLPQLRGAHVEGPFIAREKRGAQNAEHITQLTPERVAQLLENADPIRRVTLAPELPGAPELISRLTSLGIASSGGHSAAWDFEAEAAFAAGMRQVTHTFNCMSGMRRHEGERTAGLIEYALSEPEIFCELIADGRHVSPTLMRMLYQAKGAEKICLVTDATAGAGLPNENHFTLGAQDCVVRDGACWLADGAALAGSAAQMIDLVRRMVERVGVPVHSAVRMATETPARAMGWKTKGLLVAGADADFVVLTPRLEVAQVWNATSATGTAARAIPSSAPKASDS